MPESLELPEVQDKKSESLKLVLSVLPAFLIGMAFGLGKIVRDCSLTCNVGYELSPIAIIAAGIIAIPISAMTVRLAIRLGYPRWQVWSLAAIAISFFIFWFAAYSIVTRYPSGLETSASGDSWNLHVRLIYLGFFVWLGGVSVVFSPNIKRTIYKLYDSRERPKALALSTAAFISGGLAGSFVATFAIPAIMDKFDLRYELARDTLMLGMGILILLTIPVFIIISRLYPRDFFGPQNGDFTGTQASIFPNFKRINLGNSIRLIASDSKLKRMAGLILMRGMADTILLYLFYWLVTDQTPSINGRTVFFADFYIVLNASTLLLLVFGTNRMINRVGLILALLILPFTLLLGTSYLIVQTLMVVAYVLRIVDSALEQSLYSQSLDRVILQVDESQAPSVRPVFHGLAPRMGRGLGAICVLILTFGIGVTFQQMSVFFLVILVLWTLTVFSLRPHLRSV
jgi:ATP/ADP translocase